MTPPLAIFNIGTFELLLVLVVAVMLFGGDLPDVARKAARMVGKVRGMASDLGRELNRPDLGRHPDLRNLREEIRDVDAAVRGASPPRRLPSAGADVTEQGVDPARETVREERERREADRAPSTQGADEIARRAREAAADEAGWTSTSGSDAPAPLEDGAPGPSVDDEAEEADRP